MSFLIGCCLGSFLCLVAQRVPLKQSIIYPRSHCTNCKTALKISELIPLISILTQRFRCRYCQKKLSVIYFFSELLYGGIIWYAFSLPETERVTYLLWISSAYLLSLTDLFYFLVEPKLLYPISILLWAWQFRQQAIFHWGNLLLMLVLLIGCLQKKMGGGDWLLLFIWCPWLSFTVFLQLLSIACLLGLAAFGCSYLLKKKITHLPFVPFLSVALFLVRFL